MRARLTTLVCAAALAAASSPARAQELPTALRDCAYSGLTSAQVPGVDPRGVDPRSLNPLTGLRFFVDPTEPAVADAVDRDDPSSPLWKLVLQPRFRWFGLWTRPNMREKVRGYLECVPVGSWWSERALMFARYATGWVRPPRGTHLGHYRRFSLRQLGG